MNVSVVIGRFQPFHEGHLHLLSVALQESDKLIVVLGSANRSRSVKNPFTAAERKSMIRSVFREDQHRIAFVSSPDNLYKEWSWKSEIVRQVNDEIPTLDAKVTLYGHFKDDSSYYLKEFPEWSLREVNNVSEIDATGIRETYFEDGIVSSYVIPSQIDAFLTGFKLSQEYRDLCEDWEFFKWEKKAFSDYPFHETLNFMCSDAVVVCQGHILLIQRKHAPGKNTWALPGGFKNANESFLDCAVRELVEETNLRIPEKVLRGSLKDTYMFDDPRRSFGITRVSMGYYFELKPNEKGFLPEVRPASDAYKAEWVGLSEALSMNLFEDHLDIIRMFV